MPVIINVLYPKDGKFDMDYYLSSHMPLVEKTWSSKGLHNWKVVKIGPQPDGSASPYQTQAILTFESADAFKAAADADGPTIFGDIPNFTDTQPLIIGGDNIGGSK